ncbi:MAG: radical SAM protein [Planctomycetota bacterium]|nr:radical SAM protein [Planctomycetota bacterium]
MPLKEWVDGHRFSLLLELTQQCNLRCEYCVYGSHYHRARPHRQQSISVEIAEGAIRDFLQHAHHHCVIGFYGGEPMLEFDLIRHCIELAEPMAEKLGKDLVWIMTTNGTLLTDEKLDFLCQHNVSIMISMDGPKSLHDRYRRYQDGKGSFDLIMQNVERFVKRHPKYYKRGFIMTMAPPYELNACIEFFDKWADSFPLSRVTLLSYNEDQSFVKSAYSGNNKCEIEGCRRIVNGDESYIQQLMDEDAESMRQAWLQYVEAVVHNGFEKVVSLPQLRFHHLLCNSCMLAIHNRRVTDIEQCGFPRYPCFPGQSRLFCDVEGNYYPCERGCQVPVFRIGSVRNGLDYNKIRELMELSGRVLDCGNCSIQNLCGICFSIWLLSENRIDWERTAASLCEGHRHQFLNELKVYTTICEENPGTFGQVGAELLKLIPVAAPVMLKHRKCKSE